MNVDHVTNTRMCASVCVCVCVLCTRNACQNSFSSKPPSQCTNTVLCSIFGLVLGIVRLLLLNRKQNPSNTQRHADERSAHTDTRTFCGFNVSYIISSTMGRLTFCYLLTSHRITTNIIPHSYTPYFNALTRTADTHGEITYTPNANTPTRTAQCSEMFLYKNPSLFFFYSPYRNMTAENSHPCCVDKPSFDFWDVNFDRITITTIKTLIGHLMSTDLWSQFAVHGQYPVNEYPFKSRERFCHQTFPTW